VIGRGAIGAEVRGVGGVERGGASEKRSAGLRGRGRIACVCLGRRGEEGD
jgi:hypothetical protein